MPSPIRSARSARRPRPARGGDSPGLRRLPALLRHTWFALNQAFRRRISHLGITPDQYTVLRILAESDGQELTQRQLVERMFSDPNTVASLTERMVAAGLVERARHERDRRAVQLSLTSPGRLRFKQARELAQSLEEEVMTGLSAGERNHLLLQLERVAAACHSARGHSPRARPGADRV